MVEVMNKKQKKNLTRILVAFGLLVAVAVVDSLLNIPTILHYILFLVPYFIVGYDVLRKAIKNIFRGQVFDENFLMAVATIGAVCLGELEEGVAVMLFYQIGELFQSIAVGKSRKNIAALMDIRPDYANLATADGVEKVSPDAVALGSTIIVQPGERVPLDGIILSGITTLDTAALTGESLPREASVGQEIYSGSINLSGQITLQTTKVYGESTVARILEMVERSAMKKSRSENFITKFARYYTPAVCYGALALAVLPPVVLLLIGSNPAWGTWVIRALTFLVISCPCALVISIPLSFFGGIGCASAKGILVKGSNYLEALSEVTTVVFDKTGTLTEGVFSVAEVVPYEGANADNIIRLAAHAESASPHPISECIKNAYVGEWSEDVSEIKEIAGKGVSALVEGQKIYVGNDKLMAEIGLVEIPRTAAVGTICHVASDQTYLGYIRIADTIKLEAATALVDLHKAGISKTVMLTGDAKDVAKSVAAELGITEYRAELLPEDKVSAVEELMSAQATNIKATDAESTLTELSNTSSSTLKTAQKLAFVGDGINDAPVLSRADVGIAMGAMGSDAAIEAADIVLMDDNPAKIALAIKISRKTMSIVRQNIIFALGIKGLCLICGAVGIGGMWLAIFADVGVMVLAVLNATRALKI